MANKIWKRWLKAILTTGKHQSSRRTSKNLGLETLEDRTVPAQVSWSNPNSGNWDTPGNWSTGEVPGPGDDVTISTTGTASITIRAGDVESVNSVTMGTKDTLSFTGGSLAVTANSTLSGPFSMTGGTITASGTNVYFVSVGSASVSAANLIAEAGANITVTGLTTYTGVSGYLSNTLEATGTNSSLTLQNLTTLNSLNSNNEAYVQIEALAGGLVDVFNLTQIDTGQVLLESDGSGSVLNLGSLQSVAESAKLYGIDSIVQATNGGDIVDSNLNTTDYTNLVIGGNDLDTNPLISVTNGAIDVAGGNPYFGILSDINGSSVNVSGGATVDLPAIASYSDPASVGYYVPTIEATGSGSSLGLENLTSFTVNNASASQIEALSGGQINLSSLTQLDTGNVVLESSGSGSVLNLSDLTSVAETATAYTDRSALSILQSTSNGTIDDPELASLTYTDLIYDGTGTFTTDQLTSVTDGSIDISGGTPSFALLTDIDGSSVNVSGGISLTLPDVDSYNGTGFTTTFQATGTGTSLSMPNVTSTTFGTDFDGGTTMTVDGSCSVQLGSNVIDMPTSGNDITFSIPQFSTGLTIDLNSSGTFSGGTIFNVPAGDVVQLQGETFTGGATFNVSTGATLDLTGEQDVSYGGLLTASGGGTVRLSGGSLLIETGGLTLEFPGNIFQWTGGIIDAALGNLTNVGTINLNGASQEAFTDDGIFYNFGTIVQTNFGFLELATDGESPTTLINEAGASYLIESASGLEEVSDSGSAAGQVSLNNAGLIKVSPGHGSEALIDPLGSITNTGTIEVDSGTLDLDPTWGIAQVAGKTLTGGTWTVLGGGTLEFPSGTLITSNAGNITLGGQNAVIDGIAGLTSNSGIFTLGADSDFEVTGNFSNSGTLSVGGVFSVTGTFTQTSSGTFDEQIGGTPTSGLFGETLVTGAATLAGTFNFVPVNSFLAAPSETFTALTFNSETGDFSTFDLSTEFTESLTATNLYLNSTVPQPTDLAVTSVTAPTSATAGQSITVNWQVTNQGSVAATGDWQDSVYLSTTPTITSSSILLGSEQFLQSAPLDNGSLAANSAYQGSLSAIMPALTPGDYYVLVEADSLYQVNDSNRANNIMAATSGQLTLSVPTLTLGSPLDGTFTPTEENQYYQLTVPAGGSLTIALASVDSSGATALYVSQGVLPTPYSSQYSADVANQPNQSLTVPQVPLGGTYYILVQGISGAAASTGFTLTATQTSGLTVSSISSYAGGNDGNVNIEIDGTNFTPDTTASLIQGNTTISASAIDYVSATQIYATFDLTGVTIGSYSVSVQQVTNTATALSPFQVVAASPGSLSINFSVPQFIRPGRAESIVVSYTNESNTDMVAPLLRIASTNTDTSFSTPDDPNNYLQATDVLAVAPTGPAGILLPGQSGQITLTVLTTDTTDNDTIPISVSQIETGQTIDWALQESSLQPSYIPTAAWNVIWTNLMATVGTTTDSYNAALAQAATYLSGLGESNAEVSDVSNLWTFMVSQADAEFPTSTLNSATDASLPTPGSLSLSIDRTFNTNIYGRYTEGIFGLGWTTSWQMSLSFDSSGNATIDSGGSLAYFPIQANGTYADSDSVYGTLTQSGGIYTYTDTSGTQYVFLTNGMLNYEQDTNNNRIALGYNGSNQLISLTYSNPTHPLEPIEELTLTYNGQGFVSQVADGTGDVWTYNYDPDGHLTSVTAPGNLTTTYSYDTGSNPETSNALLSITNPDGSEQNFTYDSLGRLSTTNANSGVQLVTYTYPGEAEVQATDSAGDQTTVWFNEQGLPSQVESPLGGISTYQYDNNGNIISFTDAGGNLYQYAYDSNGNLTSMTNPLGQTTAMVHGSLSSLTSITDADGNTTQYSYDPAGNLLSITYPDGTSQSFTYNPLGNMTDTIEQIGDPVGYQYNGEGLVTEESFADGTSESFSYDAHGNLLTAETFDSGGNLTGTTTLTYNAANELLSITYPNGQYLDFTYNSMGQRTQSVDQSGYTLTYTYDGLGRLIGLSDGSGMIVTYSYNSLGQLSEKQNGNDTYTTYAYDADGNLTQEINYANSSGTSINSSFTYTYNVLDEMTSMTDASDNTTTYSYDATGQLTGITLPGEGGTITYVYNAAGDRTEVIDNGTTTTYTSNSDNEITAVGSATYTYDANGNVASVTDSSGTTTYAYNDLNQLVSITAPGDVVTTFQYSPLGYLIGENVGGTQTNYLVDPTGLSNIVSSYNGSGALIAHYNSGLGLASQTGPNGTGYYDFDGGGNTVGITGSSGTYVNQYSYLPFGETTTIAAALPNPFTFAGQVGVMQIAGNLFYMRARDYLPDTGQFLSNDPIGLAGGDTNIRRYVGNNPTTGIDPTGKNDTIIGPYPGINNDLRQLQHLAKEGKSELANEFGKQMVKNYKEYKDERLTKQSSDKYSSLVNDFFNSYVTDSKVENDLDPNALIGPVGYGAQGFIPDSGSLSYTIDFENDGSAAAQDVSVTEQLDNSLNWSTFQLGSIGFGPINVTVPAGLMQYQTTISYENSDGTLLNVLVDLDFNVASGLLTATFTSIDPTTGQAPTGVFDGFLYPNNASGVGQGYIQYTVQPVSGLSSDANINQQAIVVFDTNAAIPTDIASNTIDVTPPTSSINPLPVGEPSSTFTVSWSGSDANGPGIASYSIYVSVNGGAFTPWLTNTTETSATYSGTAGDSYSFYSVATDYLGLTQPTPSSGQATTAVPGPVDPANSLLSLSYSAIQLGGVTTITLQARDAEGNDEITGDLSSVVFALENKTGAKGTFSKVTNNKNGTYTATFTGTLDGNNIITATADGKAVASTPPISVEGGAVSLAESTVTIASSQITAGTTTTVTLQAEYPKNNPEPAGGLTVSFKLGSTTGSQGTFSAVTYIGNGQYRAAFTGTLAGTNTIHAYIDGLAVTSPAATVKVITGTLSLSHSLVTVSAASMKAGVTIAVAWQPEDAGGNKLNLGGSILPVFSLESGQGSFGLVKFNSKTGTYSATFTTTTVGSYTIETTYNNQAITSTAPVLTVIPAAVSLTNSVVSVSEEQFPTGSHITVTLKAEDAYGNLEAAGLAIAFLLGSSSGPGIAKGTFGKVTYEGNGIYQATFTGTGLGNNTILATIAGAKVKSAAPIIVT